MRLLRNYENLDADARGAVVAIGNFDGVHHGHRAVIETARDIARGRGAPLAVLTFEPHPREYFRPKDPPFRLTPLRSKARQLEALGVDLLFVLHFDSKLASKTAAEFVEDILVGGLGAAHIVIGYDFVFGKGRGGDAAFLSDAGHHKGFGVTQVAAVAGPDGGAFSSTLIRNLLREGKPAEAARVLGREWEVEAHVLHGDKRGRTLGFPTANLILDHYLLPAFGVYAVRAGFDRETKAGIVTDWHPAVANLGRRPTIGGDKVYLEVHIFDFEGDLYGQLMRVAMVDFLRGEKKFDGLDALQAQIAADSARAREILAAPKAEV